MFVADTNIFSYEKYNVKRMPVQQTNTFQILTFILNVKMYI